MTSVAGDFLWLRTDTKGYRTHSEIVAFVEGRGVTRDVQAIYDRLARYRAQACADFDVAGFGAAIDCALSLERADDVFGDVHNYFVEAIKDTTKMALKEHLVLSTYLFLIFYRIQSVKLLRLNHHLLRILHR